MKNKDEDIINSAADYKIHLLQMLGGKWIMPILCILKQKGTVRFNELKRDLDGITNMSLTMSLQELESYNIVARFQYLEMPPRVEYSLTENGKKLLPFLKAFDEWANDQILKHV